MRYERKRLFNASQVSGYAYQFQNSAGHFDTTGFWWPDTWYHIAYTYDGTTVTVYKDGVKDNSLANSIDWTFKSLSFALKKEISYTIKAVPSPELQTLLEKRYLCFQSWEIIAVDMGYSMHHLYKIHNQALDICDGILKRDT